MLAKISPLITIGLSLFLVFLAVIVCRKSTLMGTDYLVYMLPATLLIVWLAGLDNLQRPIRFFSSKWIIYGGEISYSFYLIHNLILRYMELALQQIFRMDMQEALPSIQIPLALVALILSLGSAIILYQWVEKPCRSQIRQWFC